jgi:hypothetical protein
MSNRTKCILLDAVMPENGCLACNALVLPLPGTHKSWEAVAVAVVAVAVAAAEGAMGAAAEPDGLHQSSPLSVSSGSRPTWSGSRLAGCMLCMLCRAGQSTAKKKAEVVIRQSDWLAEATQMLGPDRLSSILWDPMHGRLPMSVCPIVRAEQDQPASCSCRRHTASAT